MTAPDAVTVYHPARPVHVRSTLGVLRRGSGDPTFADGPDGALWWATRDAGGAPTTLRFARSGPGVEVAAWGPGAEEWAGAVPALLGAGDDVTAFRTSHPVLRDAARRAAGWRVTRTGRVLEALIPAVLEQRVTGAEARRAYRLLVRRYGQPAPGPAPGGLLVAPVAGAWRRIPSWVWRRAGVEGSRAETVSRAAGRAGRLEALAAGSPSAGRTALRTLPGVGLWTAAETAQRAFGDPDAVSVGDVHLPTLVGWALAGEPVDDAGMLELLEPYRGQRYRAVRLLELAGPRPPRFAPRAAPATHRCR
jgi:3-methyladenine DNA glycosylase/8-oxoguanine DNA glycosylase